MKVWDKGEDFFIMSLHLNGEKKETSQSLIELQSWSEIKSGSVLRVVECGETVGKRSTVARAGGNKEPALQST